MIHRDRIGILRCRLKSDLPPPPLPFIGGDRRAVAASEDFSEGIEFPKGRAVSASSPVYRFGRSVDGSLLSLSLSLARSVPPLSPYRRRDPRGQERVYNGLTGYRRGPRIKRATAKRSNRSNTRNKYHVYLSTRPTRIISTCRYALHVDLFHLLHVRYACTLFFFCFFF